MSGPGPADLERLRDLRSQIEEWMEDGYRETPEYREGYEAGRRAAQRSWGNESASAGSLPGVIYPEEYPVDEQEQQDQEQQDGGADAAQGAADAAQGTADAAKAAEPDPDLAAQGSSGAPAHASPGDADGDGVPDSDEDGGSDGEDDDS